MSYGKVMLDWPGGRHEFALDWPQLRSIESQVDMGPLHMLNTLRGGQWRLDHLLLVLRHGLMGAGMPEPEARRRLASATETHAPMAFLQPALLALSAGVFGPEPEPGTATADAVDAGGARDGE